MCEWLSCEEWCDVFLLCGGRVFSAHRAVLASVSKFLRKILLSCPVDESPTFIVMPEFDFETMSSALHYIYNGEVAIGKHQVDTFLDIMYALQVFVDTRDLIKHSKINNYALIEDKCTLERKNISLRGKDNVIIKKEVTTRTNIKFSYDNINSDQSNLDSSCYKSKRIWTGYLKSHANRRSQPFSRDLFIETYNLDRNVNGVTEGVLAIPNEYYREPASLLKTNANAEHLGEVHSDTDHKIVTEEHLNDSLYDLEHFEVKKEDSNYVDISLNNNNIENNNIPQNNLFKNIQDEISKKSIHEEQTYFINNNLISKHSLNLDTKDVDDACSSASEISTEFNKSRDNINRVTILNEVLQSPWRPRLSLTFTPGSKKCINLKAENEKSLQSKQNGVSIEDRNNNNNVSSKAENSNEAESNENEMKRNGNKDVFAHKDEDMRRHNATQYTCTECHKSFSQLRNYKYHMSVHRGTKEFSTTCPVCGKFFNDKGYLSSHMKIHRNRKEYKCSSCPKSFNQRVAYNMHVRIHTGVKPHVCEECGKAFSRKMLLKQHQRTHSGERPYSCQHCNKRFADRSNMTLHLRLHTGVKPFACSLCPKSFTKKHHLKSHLNFHTGDKPYTCPRCKLAFTQSSNMRTHMKKCNVDKE